MSASAAINDLLARARSEFESANGDARLALIRALAGSAVAPGDPAWADGRDVVGETYEQLVRQDARRPRGQFFTPLWVARPMADWLMAANPKILLDPGVGSGSMIIAADQARTSSDTTLIGIDNDPVAIELASHTQQVRAIDDLKLQTADFLTDEIELSPDAVICNPPYTRHQEIPADAKDSIFELLDEKYGRRFDRRSSMHVLFLLRALDLAQTGARLAFLTPAQWLDANYARDVKEAVLERVHVESIMTFPVTDRVFRHAVTTASITLMTKSALDHAPTRIVSVRSSKNPEQSLRVAMRTDSPSRNVRLTAEKKWSRTRPAARGGKTVPLGELARVHRGLATGCNAYFVLSELERKDLGLRKSSFVRCVSSPRQLAVDALHESDFKNMDESIPQWLLRLTSKARYPSLEEYLERGPSEFGVSDRTLVKLRVKAGREWHDLSPYPKPPILFRYLNSSSARFVRNHALAVPLNNWLGIEPLDGVDADSLFKVLGNLPNSAFEEDARHYGKGLWKLEPSELAKVRIPAEAV